MIKNWNKIGKIKAIILILLFIPNIVIPMNAGPSQGFMIITPLIFGSLFLPLLIKLNASIFGQEIIKPSWNESPITFKKPLNMFHFFAVFFIVIGVSMFIGTLIKFQEINETALSSLLFGVGILIGIFLTLRMKKK